MSLIDRQHELTLAQATGAPDQSEIENLLDECEEFDQKVQTGLSEFEKERRSEEDR